MKVLTVLALVYVLFSVSPLILPISAANQPTVGVKKGDWIEYSITITGSPQLDLARNLTSYRTEVLDTSGTTVKVNKTSTSVNGTLTSSIWNFSFTEGRVPGWAFIPANLSIGDTFFDFNMTSNVAIEGEEQKTILGTERSVTHASVIGKVYKEWDKTTGVYVHAVEQTTNYNVSTNVIATNLWSPEAKGQSPAASAQLISTFTVAVALILTVLAMILRRKKLVKKV